MAMNGKTLPIERAAIRSVGALRHNPLVLVSKAGLLSAPDIAVVLQLDLLVAYNVLHFFNPQRFPRLFAFKVKWLVVFYRIRRRNRMTVLV